MQKFNLHLSTEQLMELHVALFNQCKKLQEEKKSDEKIIGEIAARQLNRLVPIYLDVTAMVFEQAL